MPRPYPVSLRRTQRGISLIIAMLMLAVIGLTSAAVMRNATSAGQIATNNRLQTQASQLAQLALVFCENQLTLASGVRAATPYTGAPAPFTVSGNWTSGGGQPAHALTASELGGTAPRVAPQCLIETTAVPRVFTVTARGFSPDFRADAGSGATRSGSVVWLQATVLTGDIAPASGSAPPGAAASVPASTAASPPTSTAAVCAAGCTLRQRLWQRLLTPPF